MPIKDTDELNELSKSNEVANDIVVSMEQSDLSEFFGCFGQLPEEVQKEALEKVVKESVVMETQEVPLEERETSLDEQKTEETSETSQTTTEEKTTENEAEIPPEAPPIEPEGAKTEEVNMHDGILDEEEQYIYDHLDVGLYVDKQDVYDISRQYQQNKAYYQKQGYDPDKAEEMADARRKIELDSLIAKAQPYNEKKIAEAQYKAGERGRSMEVYHKVAGKKGEKPQFQLTVVDKDRTAKFYRDNIEKQKQLAQKMGNESHKSVDKMKGNAATFAKGDAESMSHATLYLTGNAMLFIITKLAEHGIEFSANLKEKIAQQGIDIKLNDSFKFDPNKNDKEANKDNQQSQNNQKGKSVDDNGQTENQQKAIDEKESTEKVKEEERVDRVDEQEAEQEAKSEEMKDDVVEEVQEDIEESVDDVKFDDEVKEVEEPEIEQTPDKKLNQDEYVYVGKADNNGDYYFEKIPESQLLNEGLDEKWIKDWTFKNDPSITNPNGYKSGNFVSPDEPNRGQKITEYMNEKMKKSPSVETIDDISFDDVEVANSKGDIGDLMDELDGGLSDIGSSVKETVGEIEEDAIEEGLEGIEEVLGSR